MDDEEAIKELVGAEDLSSIVIEDQPKKPLDSQTTSKGKKKYQIRIITNFFADVLRLSQFDQSGSYTKLLRRS